MKTNRNSESAEFGNTLEVILQERVLTIPDYQRGYSWGKQQLGEFLDDLELLPIDERQYMGVLTMQRVGEEIHVVDGQQRLITILVFCAEIRACLLNGGGGAEVDPWLTRLYALLWVDAHKVAPRLEYESQSEENETLAEILRANGNEEKHEISIYSENLRSAAKLFREHLGQVTLGKRVNYARRVLELLYFEVYFIDEWQSFVVFECLNNRGKKLSLMELLKNRLLYISTLLAADNAPETRRMIRSKVNEAWKHIYKTLGTIKVELEEPDTTFLRDHWIMRWGHKRSMKDAFKGYLLGELFHARRTSENRIDWLYLDSDLRDARRFFGDLRRPSGDAKRRKEVQALWENHFDLTRSFIDAEVTDETLADALRNDLNNLVRVGRAFAPGPQAQEIEPGSVRKELDRIFPSYLTRATATRLNADEITSYCAELNQAIDCWSCLFRPDAVARLFGQEVEQDQSLRVKALGNWLRRLNDLEFTAGRPLAMAALLRLRGKPEAGVFDCVLRLMTRLERLAFLDSLAGCPGTRDKVQELAREFWEESAAKPLETAFASAGEELDEIAGHSRNVYDALADRVKRKYSSERGTGFYGMVNVLPYLLFEYEYALQVELAGPGEGGVVIVGYERCKAEQLSVEHVFPKTPAPEDWPAFFSDQMLDAQQRQILTHSLGNLVYVTGRFNCQVSNSAYDVKRPHYMAEPGEPGDTHGTLGTREIAKINDWNPAAILKRGTELLEFVERRWRVILGTREEKARLLRLDFLPALLEVAAPTLRADLADRPLINVTTTRGGGNMLRNDQRFSPMGTLGELFGRHLQRPFWFSADVTSRALLADLQYEDLVLAVVTKDYASLEVMLPSNWPGAVNGYFQGLDDRERRVLTLAFVQHLPPTQVVKLFDPGSVTPRYVSQVKAMAKAQVRNLNAQFQGAWDILKRLIIEGTAADSDPLCRVAEDWRQVVSAILDELFEAEQVMG